MVGHRPRKVDQVLVLRGNLEQLGESKDSHSLDVEVGDSGRQVEAEDEEVSNDYIIQSRILKVVTHEGRILYKVNRQMKGLDLNNQG